MAFLECQDGQFMADGSTVDGQFYGRNRLLREIVDGLSAPRPLSYCVLGSNLIGKTRLLRHLASRDGPLSSKGDASRRLRVALVDCNAHDARENLAKVIVSRLGEQLTSARTSVSTARTSVSTEGAAEPQASVPNMSDAVRMASDHTIRPVLLLDNFDVLVQERPEAAKTAEELVPLLQEMPVVVTVSQPLYDLPGQPAPFAFVDALRQRFLGLMEYSIALAWTQASTDAFARLAADAAKLAKMTGMHPFLLSQLGHTLAGVQELVTSGKSLGAEHLPLIRMRLAEDGRQLFVALWRGLQTPSPRDELRTRMALLESLADAPITAEEATNEQSPSLNLLINRAVVVYGQHGYQFACPLFAEFVSRRIGANAAYRSRSTLTTNAAAAFASSLTKTENALLQYFQANSNLVLSHEDLLTDVWNRPDASSRRVQEAIRRLRLRLEEAVPPVGVIENERGRGYRFVPAQP